MFPIGVFLLFMGYAFVYYGIANVLTGGQGPKLNEALGFGANISPPGAPLGIGKKATPNQTGQPAQPAQPSPAQVWGYGQPGQA